MEFVKIIQFAKSSIENQGENTELHLQFSFDFKYMNSDRFSNIIISFLWFIHFPHFSEPEHAAKWGGKKEFSHG